MFSKEQFTTVTPLSKALAMIVFVVLPFVAFFLGMNIGKQMIRPIELIVIPRTENVELKEEVSWNVEFTEGWGEYQDVARGFAFYYPADWSINNSISFHEHDGGGYGQVILAGEVIFRGSLGEFGLGVQTNKSLEEFARRIASQGSTIKEIIESDREHIYVSTTEQNGLSVVEYITYDELSGDELIAFSFQTKNGSIVEIWFGILDPDEVQSKVLSTFRAI